MKIGLNAVFLDETSFGVGEYIYNLINNLPYIDTTIEYFIYRAKRSKRKLDLDSPNTKLIETPLSGSSPLKRILFEQFYWGRQLAGDKIDLYHSPFFYLPHGIKTKVVLTIHDVRFLKFPETYEKIRYLFIKEAVPRSTRRADLILASSESTKRDLIEMLNIPEEKIKVIYLGVDSIFKKITDQGLLRSARSRLNLPENYILYLGEFSAHKNLSRVIESYKLLKDKEAVNEKLVLVGAGSQNQKIVNMIKEMGLEEEVIFTGFMPRHDLPLVYNMAKIFLFPSLYEGFGLPVLEAMACGVPVVTSNVSSMPEVAGSAAILVNPYNTEEIKNAVYPLLHDEELRTTLIKKGFSRVNDFRWSATAFKTLEAYRAL